MTAVMSRPRDHRPRARGRLGLELVVVAALVVLSRVVGGMHSFDVFVDEVTYLRLSQSLAETGLPVLYGEPFYLHPPAGLLVHALVAEVVGWPGDVFGAVQQARAVVAVCAGVTAVGLRLLGGRLGGPAVGRAAALVFLLDPVMFRLTSRNLLEAPMAMWIVLGLLLLLPPSGRATPVATTGAGVLLGLAVLTKDTALLVTAAPLGAAALLGWYDRGRATLALGALVGTYCTYPAWVALHGQLGELVDQKLVGVGRLTGQVQMTGYNAHGSTPFVEQVLSRAGQLGPSYALMASGGLAALVLVVRGRGARRVVGLWTTSAVVLAAWTVLRGTLEEQLFYLLLVPSAVAVPLAVVVLRERGALPRWRSARALSALLVGLWLATAAASLADVKATQDDSFRRMTDVVAAQPEASRLTVAVMADPGDVLLRGVRVELVRDEEELRRSPADLLLVSTRSLEDGTVPADEDLLAHLRSLPVLHEVEGPSVGRLLLLRL